MASFIPEWGRLNGRSVHVKRVLNALNDEHVVRRPVRQESCPVDLFVQHGSRAWLALVIEGASFDELGTSHLFDDEPRVRFERRLAGLQGLVADDGLGDGCIDTVVLMWACSTREVDALSKEYGHRLGMRLVSREQFVQLGATWIRGLLNPVSDRYRQWLMSKFFPEAEIPFTSTTRRFFRRDNSARLDRYFLDPDQEWAAKLDMELPEEQARMAKDFSVRLVNGVAGSGKTLIALNRALLLSELFPSQRLLLLIHNTPIVADIHERLHRARHGAPGNLEVATFFAWACKQWKSVFRSRPEMPQGPGVVPELIKLHRAQVAADLRHSGQQLVDELDFINESLIVDEQGYREASRAGRGFALRPSERTQVWPLYMAVTDSLRVAGQRMWSALPSEICLAGERQAAMQHRHHILVDEAQFFAPSWFQLVKQSLRPDGQLFLCADPNQGFMRSRLSWKSVGLDVSGRTKKLRRSYRTTRAILESSTGVLALLGSSDSEDFLQPDFAGMEHGPRPLLVYTDSPQDSTERLVNELTALFEPAQIPPSAVLVIYGENLPKLGLYRQLIRRFGADKIWWFNEKNQKKVPPAGYGKDYLRMAYLDSATGLEASVVFLIGVEHLFRDHHAVGLNPEEKAERREDNARKLYMAMTRAGQRLVLLSSQRLPHDIERLFVLPGSALGSLIGLAP